ncbi:hypothetical protein AAFF_G00063920 [Aldrovandia affinis]|uniref:Uncharacterized protein n=1 Tax=Aldrovandia affinis TaxID=143900 RepID=A0AAD7T3J6_9TELE|nr:hypothetical protein AAFF_G00063920 [Aldrovandia affinis]
MGTAAAYNTFPHPSLCRENNAPPFSRAANPANTGSRTRSPRPARRKRKAFPAASARPSPPILLIGGSNRAEAESITPRRPGGPHGLTFSRGGAGPPCDQSPCTPVRAAARAPPSTKSADEQQQGLKVSLTHGAVSSTSRRCIRPLSVS